MRTAIIQGVCEDGRVELDERPAGVHRARVLVTFLPPEDVGEADRSAARRERFLKRLERGVDFGTDPLPTRDELHAGRIGQF